MTKLTKYKDLIDQEIARKNQKNLNRIEEAMNYSLEAGGKRIRPVLCFLAANLENEFEKEAKLREIVSQFALAIEMIHTYSLMQDDLPAMDNDLWRRGKNTNHVIYGEAGAILASDGLLTEAMRMMNRAAFETKNKKWRERCLLATEIILEAVGSRGMLWGQWLDLSAEGKIDKYNLKKMSLEEKIGLLMEIHHCKTGDLIRASLLAGLILGGGSGGKMAMLEEFGQNLGLCFQITDDILDETGTMESLGKTPGKDIKEGKLTYPSLFGLEKSKELAVEASERAKKSLWIFGGRGGELAEIVDELQKRTS